MQTRKKIIKTLLKYIFVFLISSFLGFLLGVFALSGFYKQGLIDALNASIVSIIISVFFGVVNLISYIIYLVKRNSIFTGAKLITYTIILLIIAASAAIGQAPLLPISSTIKLIEIEWTIFAVAISLFVIWHVVVSKYIDNKPNSDGIGFDRIMDIEKSLSYYKHNINFGIIIFLFIISLGCLVYTTPLCLISNDISVFSKIIVIFNIYLISHILFTIFQDVVDPILRKILFASQIKMNNEQLNQTMRIALIEQEIICENKKKNIIKSNQQIREEAIEKYNQIEKMMEKTDESDS